MKLVFGLVGAVCLIITPFSFAGSNSLKKTIDINHASLKELESLKGIGSKKAAAIIANRKQFGMFHQLADLTRMKGFGKPTLDRLLKWNPGKISAKK